MAIYDYEIGATEVGMTNVEDLATPLNPPRGFYFEHAVVTNRGDGQQSGHGFPTARWEFDLLTQDMIDQLRTFCSGRSAEVYIRTRINDGTMDDFSAIMIWPTDTQMETRRASNKHLAITVEFRRLVAL